MLNPYEEVPYPGRAFPQTHPDRLAVIAKLFGMDPAPPERCRVLELGCGDGGNLIPMAYTLPDSQFTGLDLAPGAIERARSFASRLGLSNLTFIAADLQDFEATGLAREPFDFIIAHGLYSWVPAPVQDKLLAIAGSSLSAQGVAYVSYNACPGALMRNIVRQILLYHTRRLPTPQKKMEEARKFLKFAANWPMVSGEYRMFLAIEAKELLGRHPSVLYHDTLAEYNEPVWFHEFAHRAATHNLQYLGDSDFHLMRVAQFPADGPDVPDLPKWPDEILEWEQYVDIVLCRWFRKTLLCRASVPLDRSLSPALVFGFRCASDLAPKDSSGPVEGAGRVEFVSGLGKSCSVTTDYLLGKAALLELREVWPDSYPFEELFRRATDRVGKAPEAQGQTPSELASFLLRLFSANMVEFRLQRSPFTIHPGDRPISSRLARFQAESGDMIATLNHRMLEITDERSRKLLLRLDGTRDRDAIAREFDESVGHVTAGIEALARLALLES